VRAPHARHTSIAFDWALFPTSIAVACAFNQHSANYWLHLHRQLLTASASPTTDCTANYWLHLHRQLLTASASPTTDCICIANYWLHLHRQLLTASASPTTDCICIANYWLHLHRQLLTASAPSTTDCICIANYWLHLHRHWLTQLIKDYNSNPTTTSLTIEEQSSVQFPAITVCNTNVLNYGALRSNVTVGLAALDGVARDANGDIDLHVTPVHIHAMGGFLCVLLFKSQQASAGCYTLFYHVILCVLLCVHTLLFKSQQASAGCWFAFARHTRSCPSLGLICITTPPLQVSPSVRDPNPLRSSRGHRAVEFWYPRRAGEALWAEPLELHWGLQHVQPKQVRKARGRRGMLVVVLEREEKKKEEVVMVVVQMVLLLILLFPTASRMLSLIGQLAASYSATLPC
jgi:hypothetical protein